MTAQLMVIAGLLLAMAVPATESPPEPAGLITPTGIPVAVVEAGLTRHLVTTPCGGTAHVTGGVPLQHVDVVLDPGHGGEIDTGAVGANGLAEKDLNLEVAREAAQILNSRGILTVLTRTGDYATTLRTRANLADTLGAEVLVSIHHNAPAQAPSPRPGIEIFHENDSADSRRLGGLIYERAMAALSRFEVDWVAPSDAGVMAVLNSGGRDAYGMIRLPETTSVLVELGYIANPSEAALFATPLYPPAAGTAVATGIIDYLQTDEPGSGYVANRLFDPLRGLARSQCEEIPLGWLVPAWMRR